jgi:hypothetical protein
VLKCDMKEIICEGVDWINLAQYRDKWRAPVNAVTKFRVPQNAEDVSAS